MARLSEEKIQAIRNGVNIVDVIGQYLDVQKAGNNYVAVCPFHDDHSPSLHINSEMQIYKCFVCGAGGNVFTFLQNYLHISFLEAVKICADLAGIDVSELDDHTKNADPALTAYLSMHEEAEKIYTLYLRTRDGLAALDYLHRRGLDDETIRAFQIGYAHPSDALTKAFQKLEFPPLQMLNSGLITASGNRLYDRFKNRVMFPLWDENGRIIAFSGRVYSPDDSGPKYLNSPESDVFSKGAMLYHYHAAKAAIRQEGFAYVAEGYMDVIALHLAGIANAVALMGTALTAKQMNLLRRVTDTVYLCLDGDEPGQAAILKNGQALLKAGFQVRVVRFKDEKDPDECLRARGKEALKRVLGSHMSFLEFLINYWYERSRMDNYDEKKEYVARLRPYLNNLTDPIDRDYYADMIAGKSGFSKAVILEGMKTTQKQPVKRTQKALESKYDRCEKELLYYMLLDVRVAQRYERELGFFYDEKRRLLANYIMDYYHRHDRLVLAELISEIKDESCIALLTEITALNLPEKVSMEVITDYIDTVKNHATQLQLNALKEELETSPDPAEKADLLNRILALRQSLAMERSS